MSRGINKVILVGNLGKDPEVTHLDSNVAVAKFPLATTETYNDKQGNRVEQTEWHNVVLWRGLAEVAEKYLRKGGRIYLEGRIQTRSYEDKDGNKKWFTEIVGREMVMLDRAPEGAAGGGPDTGSRPEPSVSGPGKKEEEAAGAAEPTGEYEDDLPF